MVKKFVFITFSILLFAGCNTNELEFDNIQVQPITGAYAFPLGEVSYTMRELIENQQDGELELQEDSTSLLTLLYQDSIGYATGGDFVRIDDITNSSTVDLTAPTPAVGPATVNISQTFNLDYQPEGDEVIDSVFYETGQVDVTLNSTLDGTLNYTFTINNTVRVDNAQPLQVSGTVVGTATSNETRSLIDHKTLLTEAIDNTFTVDFDATLTLTGAQSFTGAESLSFDITFANQTFSIIYGQFGQDTVQVGSETLDIEFFREMGEDGIFFGNPSIRFNFQNSFGIPLGIDFSTLFGDDGMGGAPTFLSGDITETLPVVAPADNNAPGQSVASTIEINSGNSSIVDLLATSPGRLGLDVMAISNPEDANGSNHLTPTSELTASIDIEIPMEIRLENLEQSGTLSLGGGLDVDDVDSVYLRVVTVNELPFSGILTLEIQDADSNSLYTVTDNLVLNAPFININGFVTDPNGVSADIPIGPTGVEALKTGSHVLLTVTLNTPGSLNSRDIFVKVLADYALEIKVGVGGTVNIDI